MAPYGSVGCLSVVGCSSSEIMCAAASVFNHQTLVEARPCPAMSLAKQTDENRNFHDKYMHIIHSYIKCVLCSDILLN